MFLKKIVRGLSKNKLIAIRNLIEEELGRTLTRQEKLRRFWNLGSSVYKRSRLTSPARPSAEALKLYNDFLNETNPKNIMILGSTPELRDLASQHKIKNYVVADFNMDMIKNNLELCTMVDQNNEVWIKSDWFSLPFPKGYFDVILGDLVLGQFAYNAQSAFLSKIAELLSPTGKFITRTHVVNTMLRNLEIKEIINRTTENLSKENETQKLIILSWRLRDKLRQENKKISDPKDILIALVDYQPKHESEENLIRRLKTTLENRKKIGLMYINQTQEETESLFEKVFTSIKKSSVKSENDEEFFPVYLLQK